MADTVVDIGDSKIVSHSSNSRGAHSLRKEREIM